MEVDYAGHQGKSSQRDPFPHLPLPNLGNPLPLQPQGSHREDTIGEN
jgi:hypothetical protein